MEKTNKILLNSLKLPDNVNVTTQFQFGMENTNKPIPLNDIDTTVDQYEQFLKERKESSIYRFYGVVKPVISNPLFNKNVKIYLNNQNEISTSTIEGSSIFGKDGWVGYFNDTPEDDSLSLLNNEKESLCEFFPFDPGYDRLRMLDGDGSQNYLMKITYPFETRDIELVQNNSGITLSNGISIVDKFEIELNGRMYTGFITVMNHGLKEGDNIKMLNFIDQTPTNTLNLNTRNYRVFKLGNITNDNKLRTFIIDVNPSDIDFVIGVSTIKRVVNNKPSEYYVRRFKSLTVSGYTDYDIYPAAYGVTYFNDDVAGFNFKTDIDVEGLTDNLGRPLSELYLSIIKNDNDSNPTSINSIYWLNQVSNLPVPFNQRFWTKISAGYNLENNVNVNYNINSYGDVNYINNGATYYENIDESQNEFDGDIVEYNENELSERKLEEVLHRVNTTYREFYNTIDSNFEDKREGYIYKPFSLIQIRDYANYINPLVNLQTIIDNFNITNPLDIEELKKSFQIPDYATEISPNVYKWRDLLDIGNSDSTGSGVDYPFESGAHYIYLDKRFYMQRQDPPCEFILISEDIKLGSSDIGNVEQNKFRELLKEPTFLKYTIDIKSISLSSNSDQSSSPENGTLVYNVNIDMNNGEGIGYYQWNGNQWIKAIFTLDSGSANTIDILNYNGVADLNVEVTLAEYIGEYELGKRDIAGSCIDFSILKENDLNDVC